MLELLKSLQNIVDCSKRIVFFGGAGVSTESGIPDFRSVDGLYNQKYKYPPEVILSHDFFMDKTREFYDFYKEKILITNVRPNPAHLWLARLEQAGRLSAVVTQNIDGLHQKAGSRAVYELHGTIHKNYCMKCGRFYDAGYIMSTTGVPRCSCGGIIKPDVVLYDEDLNSTTVGGAIRAIESADTLIVAGTSLTVYPAAGLLRYFNGDKIVLINKGKTGMEGRADLVINDSVGKVLSGIEIRQS